ncbi:hypothetical protein EOPP23_04280 [Endozoicomonas sp. OPT23]|uniref:hypothetical protein n=1 Tax=Endozoicomonas sp. OPT23 TaxID=2072845 RepID=UPI00129BE643|nr:hypothetical protein [Endozoicomonas sp. OPT23]MRI32213.1 hypothetical protein [Endozoicomonas sp. OPT23]
MKRIDLSEYTHLYCTVTLVLNLIYSGITHAKTQSVVDDARAITRLLEAQKENSDSFLLKLSHTVVDDKVKTIVFIGEDETTEMNPTLFNYLIKILHSVAYEPHPFEHIELQQANKKLLYYYQLNPPKLLQRKAEALSQLPLPYKLSPSAANSTALFPKGFYEHYKSFYLLRPQSLLSFDGAAATVGTSLGMMSLLGSYLYNGRKETLAASTVVTLSGAAYMVRSVLYNQLVVPTQLAWKSLSIPDTAPEDTETVRLDHLAEMAETLAKKIQHDDSSTIFVLANKQYILRLSFSLHNILPLVPTQCW